jgi:UPF0755 protein
MYKLARYSVLWLLVLMLTLSIGACGSASGMMLGAYLEDNAAKLEQPLDPAGDPMRFVVEPGTPAKLIGKQLLADGLIDDDLLFEAYLRENNLDNRLEAGTFVLSPAMSMVQIIEELQNALAQGLVVTIPEGWRLEQTTDFLTAANVFSDTVAGVSPSAEVYEQIALTGILGEISSPAYTFLDMRPAGSSLEGYLFPDSYELDKENPQVAVLLASQLDAFANRVLPAYAEALAAGTTTLSLHEVITLASIVEREAVVPEERPTIAAVYLNRIANGIKLDADPTVQYAMGYQLDTDQWWKTPVTLEEYAQVISPYNTYLNTGLPPGPIASPGLSSINAVLNPAQNNYIYFVALPDGSGAHVFAETYAEHLQNVARYQGGN